MDEHCDLDDRARALYKKKKFSVYLNVWHASWRHLRNTWRPIISELFLKLSINYLYVLRYECMQTWNRTEKSAVVVGFCFVLFFSSLLQTIRVHVTTKIQIKLFFFFIFLPENIGLFYLKLAKLSKFFVLVALTGLLQTQCHYTDSIVQRLLHPL